MNEITISRVLDPLTRPTFDELFSPMIVDGCYPTPADEELIDPNETTFVIPTQTVEPQLSNPTPETKTALATQEGGNHYKVFAIQPLEYCQKNHLDFCESNVVKYVTRHKLKNKGKDIRKAIHNLECLLELDYPEEYQDYLAEKNAK